ncbi:unnamed protein product [Ixodes hexagonus]
MRSPIGSFFTVAAVLLTACHISSGSISRVAVPVKNGKLLRKCLYNGHLLSDNEALDRQNPCEKAICDTQQQIVYIGLCSPMPNPYNCKTRSRPERYPYCCPVPYCRRP